MAIDTKLGMGGAAAGYADALQDYGVYEMPIAEKLAAAAFAMAAVFAAAFVFYRSVPLSAILAPLGLLYVPRRRASQAAKRRESLKRQFRDMLYSLSSSLQAGKTMEYALRDAREDLEVLYPDPGTAMIVEINIILRKAALSEPVEVALADLARRSGVEDIESFCGVVSTCRKTGGNLVEIVRNTTNILGDKLEIKNEIDVLLAQRNFERKILNVMPVFMVLALSMAAGDYIEPVFTTLAGRLVMTAAITLILLSWAVSARIMKIEV